MNNNEDNNRIDTYRPYFFPSNSRNDLLSCYNDHEDGIDNDEPYIPNNPDDDHPSNRSTKQTKNTHQPSHDLSSRLMKILGKALAITTTLAFLIAIPSIAIVVSVYKADRAKFAFIVSAATFVLITVAMSMKLIYHHLNNWYMPDVQKYVVRLLWLVPLYAIQSLLSLLFQDARIYIDTLRDLYEAFVIQSFVYYLMEILGGEDTLVSILEGKDAHHGQHDRLTGLFFHDWDMGLEFLLQCKRGVIQYVLIKTIATIATAALEPFGLYCDGEFGWDKGYTYISTVITFSQCWALYCLVLFYHATSDNLRHPVNWRPMGKFLCVKGVVFFTWWQGLAIALLRSRGIIGDIGTWGGDDVASGLQDYLVCVEMFCFAIAHKFTFTHLEYLPGHNGGVEGRHRGGMEEQLLGSSDDDGGGGGVAHRMDEAGYRFEDFGEEEEEEDFYKTPTIRTLNAPMGFLDAFWSSTSVPNETLNEIKRFRNGVSDQVMNQSSELTAISMASMQYAESI